MILMRRSVVLFCLAAVSFSSAKAQYFFYNEKYYDQDLLFEAGAGFGGINALTDLGGRKGFGKNFIKDLNIKNTRFSAGIYLAATYKSAVTFRLEATAGKVTAYDSILKNLQPNDKDGYRFRRNLSFRSIIFDVMLAAEMHPLFLANTDEDPSRWSPYLLAGIGFFSFNPQAKLNGQWHDLQPLRTEGQGFLEYPGRKPYNLRQINIPAGIGIKYEVSPVLNARFEIIHRTLFTDYLDDVSTAYINANLFANYLTPSQALLARQLHDRRGEIDPSHIPQPGYERGDPKDNDSFFTVQVKMGFVLRQKRTVGFRR
jgi:hypothetical protein